MEKCNRLISHLAFPIDYRLFQLIVPPLVFNNMIFVTCLFPISELSGQLIERVATEFNRLQFYVNKSRGFPLVEEIKPVSSDYKIDLTFS